jgi:DNA mismatch repair protein MutS2
LKTQVRDERERLENERRALQSEWAARQKQRIAALEKSFRETQKQLEEQVARLAQEIKDRALRTQTEKQAVRKFGKLTANSRAEADAAVVQALAESQRDWGLRAEAERRPVAASELAAGQRVEVKGFKRPVIFRRLDGRMAEVEAGPMRMKVPLKDVVEILRDVATAAKKSSASTSMTGAPSVTAHTLADGRAAEEINVIGCTVEEATERVDKFIDDAALASKPSVRVIHGHGTGALRRGLAEFLSSHPLVEGIHAEAEDRGGTAITVVELKG